MDCIKLQFVNSNDGGTESCDYRDGWPEGDQHKTLAEIDPAPQDLVDLVVASGPALNRVLNNMLASRYFKSLLKLAGKLMGNGEVTGLRISVSKGDGKV